MIILELLIPQPALRVESPGFSPECGFAVCGKLVDDDAVVFGDVEAIELCSAAGHETGETNGDGGIHPMTAC